MKKRVGGLKVGHGIVAPKVNGASPFRPSLNKEYVTKDTGKGREKYKSGMVRDIRVQKGRFDLLSPFVLIRLAKIYERGSYKYSERNWEKGCPFSRFLDSAFRHLVQYIAGINDGEDHIGASIWNLTAIIHFQELIEAGLMPKELDDLPKYMSQEKRRFG